MPDEQLATAEVAEVLNFDPFTSEEVKTEAAPEKASEAEGAVKAETKEEPKKEETSATPAAADEPPEGSEPEKKGQGAEEDPEVKLLRQKIQDLEKDRDRLAAPPREEKRPEKKADDVPAYDFQIPGELLDAMESDDRTVRSKALSAFASGVARSVHSLVRQEMEERGKAIPTMINAIIGQNSEMSRVKQDFYGTHKDLDRPELYPLVQSVGRQIMEETGIKEWSPTLRDAIAKRVRGLLGTQVATRPAAEPATIVSGGSPARAVTKPTEADDIARTLDLG